MAKAKKKQNFFVAYFKNFGIRQLCDILMFIGAIMLIVGLCTTQIVIAIGLGIYIAASLLALFRSVRVLVSKINRRSPEYKSAITNTVIMGIIFVLAVFGLVYAIIY